MSNSVKIITLEHEPWFLSARWMLHDQGVGAAPCYSSPLGNVALFYLHIFSCAVTQGQYRKDLFGLSYNWSGHWSEEMRRALLEWHHQSAPDKWMHCLQKKVIPEWFHFSYFHLSVGFGWLSLSAREKPISHFHAWNLLWQGRRNQQKQWFPCLWRYCGWVGWKAETITLGESRQGDLSQLMAIPSLLPPACAVPTRPSPTATSPASQMAVQQRRAGNAEAGVDALKAEATKLCRDGSGPRAVFSQAEEQRNLTALPVTENFSTREDLGKLP